MDVLSAFVYGAAVVVMLPRSRHPVAVDPRAGGRGLRPVRRSRRSTPCLARRPRPAHGRRDRGHRQLGMDSRHLRVDGGDAVAGAARAAAPLGARGGRGGRGRHRGGDAAGGDVPLSDDRQPAGRRRGGLEGPHAGPAAVGRPLRHRPRPGRRRLAGLAVGSGARRRGAGPGLAEHRRALADRCLRSCGLRPDRRRQRPAGLRGVGREPRSSRRRSCRWRCWSSCCGSGSGASTWP